ncbi:helix-turn-helix transcriptional regulator [Paenibacillus taichungensis]|uniref:helix-turn-helix domain-containing protein n=1 Tax=Paenibacillus taichungensis TaxID=484184 RepID=UPI002DC06034|nr:helix-turn-helix transcriptional regulator [Paenibacillus taichungensis]MEC0106772.1 helix-turn-helix transcriptional regulator [Paenibacillus taichungensis]MEC0195298.1 helix-turn-helix transcriptional regulator [Paenibacillus taichungensis]
MSSDLTRFVGERIRTLRKEKKYTQEFLSEKSGVHITYISDIERGERNISMETLEKLLIALEAQPVEVFRIEGIEGIEKRTNRKEIIEALNALLAGRQPEEVQMILRLAKDVLGTYDNLKE